MGVSGFAGVSGEAWATCGSPSVGFIDGAVVALFGVFPPVGAVEARFPGRLFLGLDVERFSEAVAVAKLGVNGLGVGVIMEAFAFAVFVV